MPEAVNIKAGTLDEVDELKPAVQIWTASRQAWTPLLEEVRCFEQGLD